MLRKVKRRDKQIGKCMTERICQIKGSTGAQVREQLNGRYILNEGKPSRKVRVKRMACSRGKSIVAAGGKVRTSTSKRLCIVSAPPKYTPGLH